MKSPSRVPQVIIFELGEISSQIIFFSANELNKNIGWASSGFFRRRWHFCRMILLADDGKDSEGDDFYNDDDGCDDDGYNEDDKDKDDDVCNDEDEDTN